MESNNISPIAASQPKMPDTFESARPRSVASKEVKSKDEFELYQTLRATASSITLNLELVEESDVVNDLLTSRESTDKNRSMFATTDSFNHEITHTTKKEEDILPETSQENYLPSLVGIADFNKQTSGSIIVFRLPSRSNASGVSHYTFPEGHLYRNIDSYYAGELGTKKLVPRLMNYDHNCFSSEDMARLNAPKASYSLVIRSTRRAVNILIGDIVKNLAFVTEAPGIYLVRYEEPTKKEAQQRPLRNTSSKKSATRSVEQRSLRSNLNLSDFSSSSSSSSSSSMALGSVGMGSMESLVQPVLDVVAGAESVTTDGVHDVKDADNGATSSIGAMDVVQGRKDEDVDDSSGMMIEVKHKSTAASTSSLAVAITLPEEDTEIVLVSISLSILKLLALHIVSFDTTENEEMIFITNKDHLVVFTGVFKSFSENSLVRLTPKFAHIESNKT